MANHARALPPDPGILENLIVVSQSNYIPLHGSAMAEAELQVACLCAEWCHTCIEYRPGFLALAREFPRARFRWIDIEDQAEEVGDLEVENFPTIRVTRGDALLFHGPMEPFHAQLRRLLESFTK
jgi:thioredoxin 1